MPSNIESPKVGTRWTHYNGRVYEVVAIANDPPLEDQHPLTVIYRGANGKWWTRPVSDWHRSFKPSFGA